MASDHFDSKAADWDDDPARVALARAVADTVTDVLSPSGHERLLEYGAGTGLVSQALAERVGPITLADNATGMRRVMEQKIAAGALPSSTKVWDLDLERSHSPDVRFDVIIASMVLHHVRALPTVLTRFHELLAEGGRLCVADVERPHDRSQAADFGGHPGFDRREVRAALQAAGFSDVAVADCTQLVERGKVFTVFLASARRSAGR